MLFTHPVRVFSALQAARLEPLQTDVPEYLQGTLVELALAGLVEYIAASRGRVIHHKVRLTLAGQARLREARRVVETAASPVPCAVCDDLDCFPAVHMQTLKE